MNACIGFNLNILVKWPHTPSPIGTTSIQSLTFDFREWIWQSPSTKPMQIIYDYTTKLEYEINIIHSITPLKSESLLQEHNLDNNQCKLFYRKVLYL